MIHHLLAPITEELMVAIQDTAGDVIIQDYTVRVDVPHCVLSSAHLTNSI